jgi:predicted enzyme related to lactoylglutathione lyase
LGFQEGGKLMATNPVGWFEIYVEDMRRAKDFYETVFDVTLEKLNDEQPELWKFPQTMTKYGASGALASVEGMPSGGNSTLVYFTCENCANELSRVVQAGGTIMKEKFSIGEYGFIAIAFDTEGNMIGLHSLH